MERIWALVLVVALLGGALAGCTSGESGASGGESWTYSAGGQGNADESDTIQAPTGRVHAQLSVGGQASIHLIVNDDAGNEVLRMECSGSGGCSKSQKSDTGEPGTWQITLQGLYNGGVSASVQTT